MKLRHKLIFFAATPLLLALCLIALVVRYQSVSLGQQQRATIETAYLSSKDAELRHYVDIATHAVMHLYESGKNDEATRNAAMRILTQMDYGDDGYFFVYDYDANTLVHPRQPELVGRNMWNWENVDGTHTIRKLIARAQNGGGFERYLWQKPSSNTVAPKLAYVVALPKWGWIIGTGLYLDDVDAALAQIDNQVSGHIRETMLLIAVIAILSVLVIACFGLVLNVSEHRVADAKLKQLAQRVVHTQEEERARLSRDLHDGVSQRLVSIRLQTEAALIRLEGSPEQAQRAHAAFEKTLGQMNDLLGEIRHISHDLRPAILDDLGLSSALQHLCEEWAAHCGLHIEFHAEGRADALSDVANTVLFRVAQEALNNVRRHAQAGMVEMQLSSDKRQTTLSIRDDGKGFDTGRIANHPRRGIGLRNMAERLEAVGGEFLISSSALGTLVQARIPLDASRVPHSEG
ncbi:cache domain-containing protein [Herbaspirillum lusitanum]|jgi:two-component system NarL family sensor kinase|uniref:Cache domain-containing protein n=1 Tax=Herbaspirillum lusitanum TaxID=213312 RepID=A0ABW9A3C5_9BURK